MHRQIVPGSSTEEFTLEKHRSCLWPDMLNVLDKLYAFAQVLILIPIMLML